MNAWQRRHFTIWALIFALCAYGWMSVTVQLLGTDHRHIAAPATPTIASGALMTRIADTFREVRNWRSSLYERWGLQEGPHQHADGTWHIDERVVQPGRASNAGVSSAAHTHMHLSFQRHHHATGDPTVVAIDAAAADLDGNAGSSAYVFGVALMPPGPVEVSSLLRSVTDARWPHMPGARWSDAMVSPLDRPPRS